MLAIMLWGLLFQKQSSQNNDSVTLKQDQLIYESILSEVVKQGQFLSEVHLVWIHILPSLKPVSVSRLKNPVFPTAYQELWQIKE